MKLSAFVLLLIAGLPGSLWAQNTNLSFADFRGHFIGESVSDFLRLEPDAQQEADVCRQRSSRHGCERLVGALDRGERAELSTTDSVNFVLDGGKLVKLVTLVDNGFDDAASSLTSKFGNSAQNTAIPAQDGAGETWQNRERVWDTPSVHITLYQDNNPGAPDRRLLLTVESRAEHLLDDADQKKQPSSLSFAVR